MEADSLNEFYGMSSRAATEIDAADLKDSRAAEVSEIDVSEDGARIAAQTQARARACELPVRSGDSGFCAVLCR